MIFEKVLVGVRFLHNVAVDEFIQHPPTVSAHVVRSAGRHIWLLLVLVANTLKHYLILPHIPNKLRERTSILYQPRNMHVNMVGAGEGSIRRFTFPFKPCQYVKQTINL